jgi:putative peptidoglycan lipid II flippase
MSENASVARAAWVVGWVTLLSRVFGYLRDSVVAYAVGAGFAADAFFVAFRIPNLLRRLFGEGSLTVSFIPVFTDYRAHKTEAEAKELVDVMFTLLALVLAVVTVLGVVFSPWIVSLIAPGFREQPEKFALTVGLNRVMFPYVLLVCLVALAMGVLNTLRHFFSPAFSPVILNVVMIVAALGFGRFFDVPIYALAVGVLAAGVLQVAFQAPFLARHRYLPRLNFRFGHPGVRKVALLMVPALAGIAIYNLNVFVSNALASLISEGTVSYLYYAFRLEELPMGAFAIALGTAVLPSMARQATEGRMEELKETLSFGVRLVTYVIVPCVVGLAVLARPIIALLFLRGQFTAEATVCTAQALVGYAVGLWANSAIRVVVPVFYAMKDFKTPVRMAGVAFLVNLTASLVLMGPIQGTAWPWLAKFFAAINLFGPLKHTGLALATSLASTAQVSLLLLILRRRIGLLDGRRMAKSFAGSLVASVVMGAVAWGICARIDWLVPGRTVLKAGVMTAAIVAAGVVYVAVTYALGSEELRYVLENVKRRLARKRTPPASSGSGRSTGL